MMTPEIYALWREEWEKERPGRTPPPIDQVNRMMEMFDFSLADFGLTVEE